MLHRLRAHMRFTANSGLANWCRDQMHVRWLQAVHIREGTSAAEPPINEVTNVGGGHHEFHCDVALADEAAAVDAFATLTDHNVLGLALAIPPDDTPSWVERHVCDHQEDDRLGCIVVARAEQP